MSGPEVAVRRRPKDRKAQILEAAHTLFVEQGYRNVSMAQIADRVGITAGALYRHFSNKAMLLSAVIGSSFSEAVPAFDASASLPEVLADSCRYVAVSRDGGVLWWREARHLPGEMRSELWDRLRAINRRHAELIRCERPELEESSAEVLAWGVQAVLGTPGFHSSQLPPLEFAALLTRVCMAVCAAEVTASPHVVARRRSGLSAVSKREEMLRYAVVLFDEKGYEATSLDDIGVAVGVSGPNLYSYFASKADLLQAAVERGANALWLLLHAVLRENDEPQRALVELVRGYTRLAVDQTILTSLLLTEQAALSNVAHARQREYVAEWTALLRAARPELEEMSARILVHTALGVINTMARIEHLRALESFQTDLAVLAVAVLLSA